IGYGYYASLNPSLWYVLVDHQSGAEEPSDPEKRKQPVLCPGPNQTRVPLRFAMGLLTEKPNPIPANGDSQKTGFPITATFFSGAAVDEVKAVLRDQTQRDLEHWLSTPLEPARSDAPQHNTILLIPKPPLKR